MFLPATHAPARYVAGRHILPACDLAAKAIQFLALMRLSRAVRANEGGCGQQARFHRSRFVSRREAPIAPLTPLDALFVRPEREAEPPWCPPRASGSTKTTGTLEFLIKTNDGTAGQIVSLKKGGCQRESCGPRPVRCRGGGRGMVSQSYAPAQAMRWRSRRPRGAASTSSQSPLPRCDTTTPVGRRTAHLAAHLAHLAGAVPRPSAGTASQS